MDRRSEGSSNCVGVETRCPVNGLKPSGNSSGPSVMGVGNGWGVGETNGSGVVDDSGAIWVIVGSAEPPGGMTVEVLFLHEVINKRSRRKASILRVIDLFINLWTIFA